MKKYLTPFIIPSIAIASYYLHNESLETFAVFAYWSLCFLSILCLMQSDYLNSLRKELSFPEKIRNYLMWAFHGYVLYLGFTYTIIFVVVAKLITEIVKKSNYQGINPAAHCS